MAAMRVRSVTAPDIGVDPHPLAPPPAPSPFSSHSFPFLANDLALNPAASPAPYTFGTPHFDRSHVGTRRGPPGHGHGHHKVSKKRNEESRQRHRLAKLLVHDAAKNSRKSGHLSCEGCRLRKLRCSRQRNCIACVERGEPCVWKGGRPASGLTPQDIRDGITVARRELARLSRLARLLAARYIKREAALAHAEDREPRRPPSIDDVIEAERVDEASHEGRALEEAEALLSLGTPTVGRSGDEDGRDGFGEGGYGGGMDDILVDDLFVDDVRPSASSSSSSSSRPNDFRHRGRTSSSKRPASHRSSAMSHTHGATFAPRLRVTIPHASSSGRTGPGPLSSGARSLLQQTPHAPSPLRYPPIVAQSSASPPPAPAPAPAGAAPPTRSPALAAADTGVAPSTALPSHPSFPLAPLPSTASTPPELGPTYFYPALPPPLMSPTTASHLAATRAAALAMRVDPKVLEARKSAHEKRWEGAVRRLEERRRREVRGEKADEEEGRGREKVERVTREWRVGQGGGKGDQKAAMDVGDAPSAGTTTSSSLGADKDPSSAPAPQRSPGTLSLAAKDLVTSAINRQQALRGPLSSSTSPSDPSSSFPALSHRPILSLDAQGAFSASALHHHSLLRTPSAHLVHDHHRPHTPSRLSPSSLHSASATTPTLLGGARITLSPLRSAAPHLSAVEEGLRPINSLLGALAAGAVGVDERFEPRTERARDLLLGALDDEGEGARDEWDRFEPQLEERVEQSAMEVDSPARDGDELDVGAGSGSDADTETDGRSSVGRVSRRSARSAADLEEEDEDEEDESQSGESDGGSE
ncbi:hypothetical protein JCM3775_005856 [Rhodotorula graminis]|uniref:Zn(2)-C6 fungal-type domain-containing protein n=1 Tax=Rhodotorula graminis (strain WP1) TaxID=578459 RepID=A0A0N8PZ88_RHOGW|nr:uncharacterized protein RHOBADRAFT_56481 [Rhodotorula graminis WP1]KPV71645.1 hypothetical protein RHOBADRAFT_56481 [Rhodotorula graminis WP1]